MSIKTGAKLADLRKRHGYSQEALAEKLGLSRQAISKWERGESSPDTDTLITLAQIYGVSLDDLVDHTPTSQTAPTEAPVFTPSPQQQTPSQSQAPSIAQAAQNWRKKRQQKPLLYPNLASKLLKFPFPIIVLVIYLLLGFVAKLWHPMWILFLLIPAYYHFALISARASSKKQFLLGLPVIETALILFLVIGFFFSGWAWAWVLFLVALVYYWYIAVSYKEKKQGDAADD